MSEETQPLPEPVTELPQCDVLIKKDGDFSVRCQDQAATMIYFNDPVSMQVTGIIFVCARHAEKYESNKTLLTQDEDGNLEMVGKGAPPEAPSVPPKSE